MNRQFYILAIFLFSVSCSFLLAQEEYNNYPKSDTLEILKSVEVIGVPIVFYTPETNFGFGGGVQFMFNEMRNVFNSRLSDMMVTAIYTSKNQLLIDIKPQFHIYDGQFFLQGLVKYKIFPNSFWGIGNQSHSDSLEQYNMQSTEVSIMLQKTMPPDVNFGFEYLFQRHKFIEYDPEGQLLNKDIYGSDGAIISALAVAFTFDDRDNIYSTQKGNYVHLKAGFSSKVLGSTYGYNKYVFDLRKYIAVLPQLTVAGQFYLEATYGRVPFQTMPWLGGGEKARGYFKGRYIDNHYYATQAELRWHFLPRFILVGFVSSAEVADVLDNLFNDFKPSYGGGIRFQISKKSPTVVRLDIGIGRAENSGVYFGVNEAF